MLLLKDIAVSLEEKKEVDISQDALNKDGNCNVDTHLCVLKQAGKVWVLIVWPQFKAPLFINKFYLTFQDKAQVSIQGTVKPEAQYFEFSDGSVKATQQPIKTYISRDQAHRKFMKASLAL